MRQKKIKAVFIFIIVVLLGGVSILYLFGKPVQIDTDQKLDSVSEEICDAFYYASLAANSHNMQSWKVNLDTQEQQFTISIDEKRTLEIADPECRELYISLGCYIESLTFAFDAYGYDTVTEYAESPDTRSEAATVSYCKRENAETDSGQLETIKRRHTDKRAYNTEKIDADIIAALLNDDSGIYSYQVGSDEFDYLKNGTVEAISKQSTQSVYREELNQWMRFSNRETAQKKDGISGEMIGLSGITKAFYYLTTNHGNADGDTFAQQGIDTAKKQTEKCSAFFVITGNDTVIDWMNAGRRTQAFWYQCVENNIAVQPLSAMLEVAPYSEEIQERLGAAKDVQMILRAGNVNDYGENAAVRRNLNEYITVVNGN